MDNNIEEDVEEKYTFETDNHFDMNLVTNRYKLMTTLWDLKNWRNNLKKGEDGNIMYLYNGRLYSYSELQENLAIPRNKDGTIRRLKKVYLINDIINTIDNIASEAFDIVKL